MAISRILIDVKEENLEIEGEAEWVDVKLKELTAPDGLLTQWNKEKYSKKRFC